MVPLRPESQYFQNKHIDSAVPSQSSAYGSAEPRHEFQEITGISALVFVLVWECSTMRVMECLHDFTCLLFAYPNCHPSVLLAGGGGVWGT